MHVISGEIITYLGEGLFGWIVFNAGCFVTQCQMVCSIFLMEAWNLCWLVRLLRDGWFFVWWMYLTNGGFFITCKFLVLLWYKRQEFDVYLICSNEIKTVSLTWGEGGGYWNSGVIVM
jgi:hypothetical protein